MKLPKIDLLSLPDIHSLAGIFASGRTGPGHDDRIVVLATVVFESSPPGGGII